MMSQTMFPFPMCPQSHNPYEVLCTDCDSPCELCDFEDSFRVPYCEVAMAHSTSNGSSTTIESLSIDPGYWRSTATSKNVLVCYHTDACRGGVTGSSDFCRKGYQGPCELGSGGNIFLKKNQNAPRPSEHPPVMGEKMSKCLGGIKGCKYKTSS